ncbi:dihydrofolate reductase family protein [Ornithinibacillus gellani]|uniref:dihydrofolate reductase family protein n=1 Tax=Ornithinibacillus gellani TaxID=2293253 RepID=UPI001CC1EFE0|nr:dihydrofolate reductase family protein [Ornithinibacillus gellani]
MTKKIIATEFISLDGIMEDPGGAEKTKHGGWSGQYWNEEAQKYKYDELFATDALLLGRVTYEGFAQAWPSMTDDDGFAERMNSIKKYVISETLEDTKWNNSTLVKGNVIEQIAKLKQDAGQNMVIHGSAELINTLLPHQLIDEIRLMIFPIVQGCGKRLFKETTGTNHLKLLESKTFETGVMVLHYQLS